MSKYSVLLNILDKIRSEALSTKFATLYNPAPPDEEKTNQARARAFIHLYLKVSFGLLSFEERERRVTDGAADGGIDGYFIDRENKTIYFIQSKFRTTQSNFENKEIALDEILVMDINRILTGEESDDNGIAYNGKIKGMIREISAIDEIARYHYQVVLLANLKEMPQTKLRQLSGGYPVAVFNHGECYTRLVFPVISGTFFNASDLNIYIDLSNKNAGSKISYTVTTKTSDCEITVLFVPIIEIAKVLHKYKNSILKYNPRSYLELEGKKVNTAIRETVTNKTTNEFALFNNGITMLSDETYINEKIGQKNKAQLTVKNPQIINGGQTAYTLSRLYESTLPEQVETLFLGKEVLLKVITLLSGGQQVDHQTKIDLIDEISAATNQQTAVIPADRHSNEQAFLDIQRLLFDRYGLLYERKRGEFGDGLFNGYVSIDQVLERNLFFRIFLATKGEINRAVEKKLFTKYRDPVSTIRDLSSLDKFYFGYLTYQRLAPKSSPDFEHHRKELYGMIYAFTAKYKPDRIDDFKLKVDTSLLQFQSEWQAFLTKAATAQQDSLITYRDRQTGKPVTIFSRSRWAKKPQFEQEVKTYFQ